MAPNAGLFRFAAGGLGFKLNELIDHRTLNGGGIFELLGKG